MASTSEPSVVASASTLPVTSKTITATTETRATGAASRIASTLRMHWVMDGILTTARWTTWTQPGRIFFSTHAVVKARSRPAGATPRSGQLE